MSFPFQRVLQLPFILAAVPAAAQQRPCDAPDPLGPSRDLYCMELVPAPGIVGVSGRVELGHIPGPFTIAVTPDGRLRYRPIISLAGLPSPQSLGKFRTYVAWVAPPTMYPVLKLGEVKNGTVALPGVDLEKFTILVTAEPNRFAEHPSSRLVLRGQSPSTRLFPPDLYEFSIGSMGTAPGSDHRQHHEMAADSGTRWTMVPMPRGLTMLPAEMALRPDASPYLPPSNEGPLARPSEVVRLNAGDTLRLEAGLVRRTLRGRD